MIESVPLIISWMHPCVRVNAFVLEIVRSFAAQKSISRCPFSLIRSVACGPATFSLVWFCWVPTLTLKSFIIARRSLAGTLLIVCCRSM